MKKSIVLTGLSMLLIATSVIAQRGVLRIGIDGGPGLSFKTQNPKSIIAGASFLNVEYAVSDHVGFQLGFGYSRVGYSLDLLYTDQNGNPISYDDYEWENRIDNLSIPLLTKFSFGSKVRGFVNIGSFISIPFQRKQVTNSPLTGKYEVQNRHVNFVDVGIVTGVGLGIDISSDLRATLELRNSLGLVENFPWDGGGFINSTNLLLGISYVLVK